MITALSSVLAEGFWDDNFTAGKIRTEYATNKGTAANPLAITFSASLPGIEGCQFNAADAFSACPGRAGLPNLPNNVPVWRGGLQRDLACNGDSQRIGDSWVGCIQYSGSPYFSINNPDQSYWVIHANNDPSFDQCKNGPPGLSEEILTHSAGQDSLFKISTEEVQSNGGSRKKLRMGVYSSEYDYYCSINDGFELGNIPFISVGAQKQRGNLTSLGTIGNSNQGGKSTVRFDAKVTAYAPFNCPESQYPECNGINDDETFGVHAGIYTMVKYNDLSYMLFLNLYTTGVYAIHQSPSVSFWNWPIEDSFLYPGAKIANFTAGPELMNSCGFDYPTLSFTNKSYQINVTELFQCAKALGYYSELPDVGLEIMGFHWFIETFGPDGQFELNLEKMQVHVDDLIFLSHFN